MGWGLGLGARVRVRLLLGHTPAGAALAGECAATHRPVPSCGSLIFHVRLSCLRLPSTSAEQNGCLSESARR